MNDSAARCQSREEALPAGKVKSLLLRPSPLKTFVFRRVCFIVFPRLKLLPLLLVASIRLLSRGISLTRRTQPWYSRLKVKQRSESVTGVAILLGLLTVGTLIAGIEIPTWLYIADAVIVPSFIA